MKLARCVVQSNDLVAYEDLQVRNMVKNKKLSKSISDAAWTAFRNWIEYFGKVFGVATVAVPPHYTSQNCSSCGKVAQKSLIKSKNTYLSTLWIRFRPRLERRSQHIRTWIAYRGAHGNLKRLWRYRQEFE